MRSSLASSFRSLLSTSLLLLAMPAAHLHAAGIDYATTIQPIYNSLCTPCHQGASPDAGLNLVTSSYANTVNKTSGKYGSYRVRPNFATSALSAVYTTIVVQGSGANHNGLGWVATATQKANITDWINQGALPNLNAPTVTSLNITTGSAAGGTAVTITGTAYGGTGAFVPVVTFGGVAATNVVVTTGLFTKITCTTPAHAAGAVDVVVTTTAGGASSPLVNGFTYTSGAPTQLAFGTQPSATTAGATISPAVTVKILDSTGAQTSSTANVTLALGSNPGSSTLSGTTTVAAVAGLATFSNLSLNRAGAGYTLAASSSGLTGATSSSFTINASTPGVVSPTRTSIAANSATLGGNVTSDGGATVSERGIVLALTSVNSNPTLGGTGVTAITAAAGGTGVFTINAASLQSGVSYSFAAYASNGTSTGYSSTSTFTTLSNNANLSSLVTSAGSLDPVFDSAVIGYAVSVPSTTSTITVTPTTAASSATVQVNSSIVTSGNASGVINLSTGSNVITILVTAQDGTPKTYTVNVTRSSTNSTSTLSALVPSVGALSPAFAFSTTSYSISLPLETTAISFTPTLTVGGSTVTVNGNTVADGVASSPITLNQGSNTVTIVVTAQDTVTTTTYVVNVSRLPSANADLASLTPSSGALSPIFASGTTSYVLDLPNATTSVSFTPVTAESHATMQFNGSALTSSNASAPLTLVEGDNAVSVVVTAQSGVVKTYSVNVKRAYRGAPRIVVQPASQVIAPSASVTFSVSAVGSSTLTYQWKKGAAIIPAANASSYTIPAVLATNAGAYSVVVTNSLGTVTSDAATLTVSAVAGVPQITSQPMSALVALGSTATFATTATGNATLMYQWRKGAAAIALATNSSYTTPAAALTSAGTYSVLVKNMQGSVASTGARLGVVSKANATKLAKATNAVTLTVAAAGDGLIYHWKKDGVELSDSIVGTHIVSGTSAASLVIKGSTTADTGSYTCLVRMGSLNMESGATALKVYDKAPIIQLAANDPLPPAIVSGSYRYQVPVDSSSDRAVVTFSSTPLPAGLKLDAATGIISGKPTVASPTTPVAKPFIITLTATNGVNKHSVPVQLTISSLPVMAVGTFNGLVDRDASLTSGHSLNTTKTVSFGGSLNVTIAGTGIFSGNFTLGATTYRFLTKALDSGIGINPTATVVVLRTAPQPALTLAFSIDATTGELTGSITDGVVPAVNVRAWRHTAPTAALLGAYTAVLDFTSPQTPDPTGDLAYPQGNGFGTLTVTATGAAWSGKMADGTAATFSTTVGSTGRIPFHLMLYTNTGSAHGWMQIAADSVSTPTNAGLPLLDGTIDWVKAAQPTASTNHNYKSGFALHSLTIAGGKYVKPTTTVLGLTDGGVGTTNARLTFSDGGLTGPAPIVGASMATALNATTFRITSTNALIVLPTANPATLTFTSFNASTGAIAGTATLANDPDPTDHIAPIAMLSRKVTYAGVLVPRVGINQGVGYFLLSKLPEDGPPKTTLTTSDILSGQIVLGAK